MTALSFSVFKDKILDGSKTQTIRKARKRPIKVGDQLQLYWQQRTKDCELLLSAKCITLATVEIHEDCLMIDWDIPTKGNAELFFYAREMNEFATLDGFKDWDAMQDWFGKIHRLPFKGVLIQWERND